VTNTEATLPKGTKSHPYLAVVVIDPADLWRLEQVFEDRPEARIRKVDQGTPDTWTIYIACASQRVCDLIEGNW
jgi:hypothetical protein